MSSTSDQRDRGEQILSAKKKLKSYRAKQALVTQKRSSASFAHVRTGSTHSQSSNAPSTPRSSDATGRPSSTAYAIAPSQDRTGLRARHAHRHSRNASISVPTSGLLPQLSPSPSAQSMSPRPPTSSMTPSSSMGHIRTHSRSQSRTFARSRPASIALLGARQAEPVIVAIEHPAESNAPGGWSHSITHPPPTSYSADTPYRRSQHFLDSSTLFGASAPGKRTSQVGNKENTTPVQPVPLDFFSTPSTAPASMPPSTARQSRRLSRHARNTSISTKRESMEIMGGVGLGIADSAHVTNSMGSTRRQSSRLSNLPSASVLFGAAEPAEREPNSVQSWNWRAAMPNTPIHQDEEDGRLTALEKLEGRTAKAASVLFEDLTNKPMPRSSSNSSLRASKRFSGHSRTDSIQIPNLDEIHQNEINERRASWKPSPNPDAFPLSPEPSSSSARRESWKSTLMPPVSTPLVNGFSSPALSSSYLSSPALPSSIVTHAEPPQPEGLGTLLEEEEEEESLTPLRERASLELPKSLAEEDDRRQRREAEEEIVKRNRRSSLAPRPLKLKSRPPSLFLAPALRNGLPHSPSLPELPLSPVSATNLSDETTPKMSAVAAPFTSESDEATSIDALSDLPAVAEPVDPHASQATDTDVSDADSSLQASTPSQIDEERQRDAIQMGILRAHRASMAAVPAISDVDAGASAPAPSQRQGMRTLRLGSMASLASVMESGPPSSGPGSANANKRRSMIIGSGPLPATPLTRDNEPSSASTAASARAARRSSIMYKAPALSSSEHGSGHSASESISLGSVPLAVHDELKTKANRDAVLLESTKRQVELLERELANESERSATERSQLEQWSAEREQQLFERARNAEMVANESTELSASLRAELATAKELVEDLQAEREVLQDDIDGWRTRCQDLEKTLRIEQAKAIDQRRLRSAARLRLRQLTDTLERAGVEVPVDELGIYQAMDQSTIDAAPSHRSPALGSGSPSKSGSPSASPVMGDVPSPQIAKLLTQMRQQIMTLAGSLEHERTQHSKTKEEVSRLQFAGSADESQISTADISNTVDDSMDSGMSAALSSTRPSSGVVGKNKRHIFAYDSSMGSLGQSQSSASLSMVTDDTTHTDYDSDVSDWTGRKLLPSESETVGLGVGGLHILDEIEEVSESLEGASTSSTVHTATKALDGSPAWIDIEAGPCRPSLDVSESSFGIPFEDAEIAPPTPDLYRAEETFSSPLVTMDAFPTSVEPISSGLSKASSSSSAESQAAPSTPSPRPEFIREWSFELGLRRSAGKNPAPADVEDFFGILREDHLPALSTSEEALDLPPIVIQRNGGIVPTAKITKEGVPVAAAGPSRIASLIGGRRPPIARSAYARESIDATHRPTTSSTTVPIMRQRTDSNASSVSAGGLAAMGGRLSRMSLQNLTGAFSGLSGYLTNQSGAAVTAAAAATQMCNSQTTPGSFPGMHADLLESGGWSAQRRTLDDDFFDEEAGGKVGMAPQYDRNSKQISFSSVRSSSSHLDAFNQPKAAHPLRRAFVKKDAVAPPKPTPVWMLNFEKSTLNAMGPLISL